MTAVIIRNTAVKECNETITYHLIMHMMQLITITCLLSASTEMPDDHCITHAKTTVKTERHVGK